MDLGKLSELSEKRKCQECGAVFENAEQTALQQFADHLVTHQPTGAQWTTAYNMNQAGKVKNKSSGLT